MGEFARQKKKCIRVKLISMGNAEVGKSCIIKRYCEKRFVSKYLTTIGIDYGVTKLSVKNREVKVNIFDMAGHPIFYEVRNEFYRDTQGAMLVFDVSNRQSFDALEGWVDEMKQELATPSDIASVVFIVCGNKADRKREVLESEACLWAESRGYLYHEVSAMTGDGVNEMFEALFNNMVEAFENGGKPPSVSTTLGYTQEQANAIHRLTNSKDNHDRLGLSTNASKDDINRAYRRLAVLLHPDKSVAPGSEEAFKVLVTARTTLLQRLQNTS